MSEDKNPAANKNRVCGAVTVYPDGGSSHTEFSYTGYPILKKITLPKALQHEWAVAAWGGDASEADFDRIFGKYAAGRELIRSMHVLPEAKDHDCLAIHIVGLPKEIKAAKCTHLILNHKLGGDADGIGSQTPPDTFRQYLHKDLGGGGTADASTLYSRPHNMDGYVPEVSINEDGRAFLYMPAERANRVPTMLATNDEWLHAAAAEETRFRSIIEKEFYDERLSSHRLLSKLPPTDRPIEQKIAWLRTQLGNSYKTRGKGKMDYCERVVRDKYEDVPKSVHEYAMQLLRHTSYDHDYAVPVMLQSGDALLFNNRAMVHGRGEPPGPKSEWHRYKRQFDFTRIDSGKFATR